MWDHYFTMMLWLLFRLALTHDDHLGYDVPIFPFRFFLPWHTGVFHHDYHHMAFNANYAPTFTYFDAWFGSDAEYNKWWSKRTTTEGIKLMREKEMEKYGTVIEISKKYEALKQVTKEEEEESTSASDDAKEVKETSNLGGGPRVGEDSEITKEMVRDIMTIGHENAMTKEELEKMRMEQLEYAEKKAGANWDYSDTTIAITGSEGLVGKSLVRLLRGRKVKKIVRIDVVKGEETVELDDGNMSAKSVLQMIYEQVDIAADDAGKKLQGIFERESVDVVFHLAALVGPFFQHDLYEKVNFVGSSSVCKAAATSSCTKVLVDCSSPCTRITGVDVDGLTEDELHNMHPESTYTENAIHEYARTKYLGEKVILEANNSKHPKQQDKALKTCAILPHQLYGSEDKLFLPSFVENARKGKLRMLGRKNVSVSFTHSDNVAHGLLCAGKALLNEGKSSGSIGGRAYMVTDGNVMPIWDPIDQCVQRSGYTSIRRMIYIPRAFLLFLSYFLEYCVYWPMNICLEKEKKKWNKLSPFTVRLMTMNRFMTIADLKHLTGYVPLRNPVEAWESTIQTVVEAERTLRGKKKQ